VQALTDLVATELGLSDADAQRHRWAALLHDIGKVRVPRVVTS
jgi:putative nucleotidyltransferase with HDIG domain